MREPGLGILNWGSGAMWARAGNSLTLFTWAGKSRMAMKDFGNNDRGVVPRPRRRRDDWALRWRRGAGRAPGNTVPGAASRPAGKWALWARRVFGVAAPLATIVAGAVALHHCWFEGPDREEREAFYRGKIAELEALEDPASTGPAIHRYLSAMHQDDLDMNSIVITGVALEMAEFQKADWSWATMTEVEFVCSGQVYRDLGPFGPPDYRSRPCARLRNARFVGTGLHQARFEFADLRGSAFKNSYLNGAKILYSVLSKANFSQAVVAGIQIAGSDFERAIFGSSRSFECHEDDGTRVCPLIRSVNFRHANMPLARFVRADIHLVDFGDAILSEALFDCRDPDNPRTCTRLDGICFQGTDLTKAFFANVEIAHSDFSDAKMAGAVFRKVRFDDVVFPRRVSGAATFDRASAASLEAARRTRLGPGERNRPCTSAWRRGLSEERRRIAFAPPP